MSMKVPSVTFIENNVGFIPVRSNIRNRIGIISTFSRGSTDPTFITGDPFFADNYGYDTTVGSLAYQAARAQGAEDFLVTRVLGHAKVAKGTVVLAGTATVANTLILNVRFVGEAQLTTDIEDIVVTSGQYTGSVSGRFYFKVTALTANVATVSYTFIALGADETIDWPTITTSFSLNLNTDKGVTKNVANGVSVTFGQVAQSTNISVVLNDEFRLRVSAFTYPVAVNVGDIPYQIANAMASAISGVDVIGDVTLTSNNNGLVFEIDSTNPELVGTIGNRFTYRAVLQNPDTGLVITPSTTVNFAGGEQGPRQAFVDFFSVNGTPLLRLQANYVGNYGNNIRITIFPDKSDSFRLLVEDLNAVNFNPRLRAESFVLDFRNLDENGLLNQLSSSTYVNGIFLPKFADPVGYDVSLIAQAPVRLAAPVTSITDVNDKRHPSYVGPNKLINISLEGGFDGPAITDNDYIKALSNFEALPVHILIAPGVTSTSVQQSLISHCERSSEKDGLRVAILSARPSLSPNSTKQETFGFDSKRAVKVAGWSTYGGQPNSPRFGLAPDSIYAGILAAIPFYTSPHARRSAGSALGITEVDTARNSSTSALQLYTDAKLDVLHVDPASRGFFFTSGITLSSDPAWRSIYVRRSYDFIEQDLYEMLSFYLGEPHTLRIRVQIQSSVEQYLRRLAGLSYIANYRNVSVNSENNSADLYSQGNLNVNFDFLPLEAINYITVTINRNNADGLLSSGN